MISKKIKQVALDHSCPKPSQETNNQLAHLIIIVGASMVMMSMKKILRMMVKIKNKKQLSQTH